MIVVVGLVEALFVAVVVVVAVVLVVLALAVGDVPYHQQEENADADVEPFPPPRHKQTHETDNTTTKETAYTSAVRVFVKQKPEDKTGCHA